MNAASDVIVTEPNLLAPNHGGSIPFPQIGFPLPIHPQWASDCRRYDFLDLSYRGGPEYKKGYDSQGCPVLIEHDRETAVGRDRRTRLGVYVNHCRPIVRRFTDFVFRQDIQRCTDDSIFTEWTKDVDLQSTPLQTFMRSVVRRACVLGRYFVAVDTTRPSGLEDMTRTQALAAKVRMFLKRVDPRRVVNWRRESDVLTEALVLYDDSSSAILWTPHVRVSMTLDEQGLVTSIISVDHGWPRLPLIELVPFDGDSQIGDIAELNRDLFNHGTLLREELYNSTFTMRLMFGVRSSDLADESGTMESGSNRLLCIPNPDAKLEVSGGDPAQAESIRKTITDSTTEIYRQCGLRAEDPMTTTAPQSGIALKVRFDEVSAQLSAIAEEAERVEGEIVKLYNVANGTDVQPPDYPEQFGQPDAGVELGRSLAVLESPQVVPAVKRLEALRLARILHPKAAARDVSLIERQVRELFADETMETEADRQAGADQMAELLKRNFQGDNTPAGGAGSDNPDAGGDGGSD
ncbi:MAG TPA: hypothetical protein PKY77_05700 [Phycisphaerae bacterium]|nr:hypothetical protein [Phycisphaerae bacterium]HRY69062.1 hypothetical protein [Phycisphaerae bacterium]HSA25963.1 hypothetical protein [Phycisphaerae bacterium]